MALERSLHNLIDTFLRGQVAPTLATGKATTVDDAPVDEDTKEFASAKTPTEAYALYEKKYPGVGYMKVQAFTARRAYPVAGARVEISKMFPQGKYVITQFVTDEQGETPTVKLPAADKSLSESPGHPHPYTTVDVQVLHPDYVAMNYLGAPVFEDIISIQAADLIPLAASNGQTSMTVTEQEPDL